MSPIDVKSVVSVISMGSVVAVVLVEVALVEVALVEVLMEVMIVG